MTQVLLDTVSESSALAAVKWCPLSVCFDIRDVAKRGEGSGLIWTFDFSYDRFGCFVEDYLTKNEGLNLGYKYQLLPRKSFLYIIACCTVVTPCIWQGAGMS